VKLPLNVPEDIVHVEEVKRSDGEDAREHVVPA
jgi:hypothetical protein